MIETKLYTLNSKTYLRIYRDINANSRKKALITFSVVVLIVAGLSIYDHQNCGGYQVLKSWLPFLGFLSALYLYLYWLFPIRYFRSKLNKNYFSTRVNRFFEDRLETESNDGSTTSVPYNSFVKHKIGDNYLAFWESSLVAHVVPSEAFESQGDFIAAAEYVRRAANA